MIQLPHGCWMSTPSVNPRNWKKVSASIKKPWYIQYYFHDPAFGDDPKFARGKLCIIKGMNHYTTSEERREATIALVNEEIRILKVEGFNPITKKFNPVIDVNYVVDPNTGFIAALNAVLDRLKCTVHTKEDIRSVIKYFSRATARLQIDHAPIKDIRRKHLRLALDECASVKKKWSANQFNVYRKYLMILFNELVELEACESNPLKAIKKADTVKRIRTVLTPEERKKVDEILKDKHYTLWRFMHIFFHSGSRESEMVRVQGKDVDLINQRFKVVIKKGRRSIEKWKTIKDIVLPLWQEVMAKCGPEDYVFSVGLIPGKRSIRPDQVSRRWNRHIKKKHGIQADFYSLKHLNLDETAEALSIEYAAKMAGHSTPVITLQHYAHGQKERDHQILKKVNNSFA